MIPLLDLKAQNAPMQDAIEAALLRVARSGRYILGPEVEAFEAEWAAYCGTRHCVGTGNALDALQHGADGVGIGDGDEVIVPSNTYIATWLAVSLAGATPVPVEPDARPTTSTRRASRRRSRRARARSSPCTCTASRRDGRDRTHRQERHGL
jgi:dTDP-4-amino-4,6-dideoxygalactose transaminase